MNKRTKIQELLAASGDRPTNFYDRAPQHEGFIAEKDVSVPMRDGVNLSVDVYRPKENGKYPALLAFSSITRIFRGRMWLSIAATTRVVVPLGGSA